ncbi:hypothetical protein [Parahaliea mediterranea]|uniref:hypothetical protein n=1 Tax=Parahaliea mediterranea TaxID=651086 RepID=UPI0013003426|nr:hypothetical protein [Parahaliea mediterranea]
MSIVRSPCNESPGRLCLRGNLLRAASETLSNLRCGNCTACARMYFFLTKQADIGKTQAITDSGLRDSTGIAHTNGAPLANGAPK